MTLKLAKDTIFLRLIFLNDDGTINANGGKFEGMDRYDARKQIVEELDEMGLFHQKRRNQPCRRCSR